MKLNQNVAEHIEKSEALFVVGTLGDSYFAAIEGDLPDRELVERLALALINHIESLVQGKYSSPLLEAIVYAQKIYPQLRYEKEKDQDLN